MLPDVLRQQSVHGAGTDEPLPRLRPQQVQLIAITRHPASLEDAGSADHDSTRLFAKTSAQLAGAQHYTAERRIGVLRGPVVFVPELYVTSTLPVVVGVIAT